MITINMIHETFSHRFSSKRMPKRNEMAKLTELIDNHQHGISSTGLGKALNKVHGDNFPRCRRGWQWLQQDWILGPVRLSLLTNRAGLYKGVDVGLHFHPIEELLDFLVCDRNAGMDTERAGMQGMHDLLLHGLVGS
jgi:hypothetical protein